MLQEKESIKQANEFAIERVFNAPRHLVWKAFAEAERLAQWWGPAGFKMEVKKLELSPGGTFHYSMQSSDGFIMWGKFVYLQIVEPEKIVFILSFSDENGAITRAPMSATWPLEVFNVLTFKEHDGKTTVTLKGHPVNATEEEIETFRNEFEGMNQGFSSTFDQLDEYLAKLLFDHS
ncbi:MAG TPA: SRPBCC domain-containing protein [Chitinophagaceae bacterium]|jgi:uncharacterized protein YndB with AHSA1/START domain|nr:SRPBCC domain-containing protein [Chitinophagaceae bacterium]